MSPVKYIGVLIVFIFTLLSVTLVGSSAHASAMAGPIESNVEIEPICSSAVRSVSEWKVTNKNDVEVAIKWDNFKNNLSGDYTAAAGQSKLITGYNALDPNNTTKFTYASGADIGTTNATKAACEEVTPPVTTCVNGMMQDNLMATYLNDNTIQVSTKNGALLCDDVQLYFSSYVMPRNYNGEDFEGNTTAYPQSVYDSVSITLHAGTTGEGIYSVDYPDCENVQFDLYYAPEITTVGENGHGSQNILSNVVMRSEADCKPGQGGGTPPTEPTTPTEPQQPVTPPVAPVAPVTPIVGGMGSTTGQIQKPTAQLPSELPQTGASSSLSIILMGIIISAIVYISLYTLLPKRV
jgi:LPXTG-motif cell wall-anchored protein